MNIALCHENVDPTRGGCETYIADLARRLVADGHEVHLYCSRWNPAALPAGLALWRVRRLPGPRCLRPWLFGQACRRAMKRQDHDVSIGFDKSWGQDVLYPQGGVYAASQSANCRKYASPTARAAISLLKAVDPAVRSFRLLERLQYSRWLAPTVIVNSEMVRLHAVRYLKLDPARVHVVHAAVDPARFAAVDRASIRAATRRDWGVSEHVPVGLFLAMNYRLKGLDPLLEAVRRVPHETPFQLAIVGHPDFAAYARRARRLGVGERVIFHGYCADARRVYFAGDFLIHPTFYDPCSLVALEALACGLPVITSAHNGAAELLHPPHDGLIVANPHDHGELAAAIVDMLDPARRAARTERARRTSTIWTFEHHYRKMMAILEEVAARKQTSGRVLSAV